MERKTINIDIPNNLEIDWEESKKQNKIVLKDKQLTYEDVCDRLPDMIDIPLFDTPSEDGNALVANEHYLECLLAKNKLANVAKYLNDGWEPGIHEIVYRIANYANNDNKCSDLTPRKEYFGTSFCSSNVIFKSEKLVQQAIEILGEETVKLALEPLGI